MADTLSLYKLIILKMLEQVEYPLTNSQITEFILDKEYTNYFTVQQALSEMDETGLVNLTTKRNNSLYHITDAGKNTLEFFGNKISDAILTELHGSRSCVPPGNCEYLSGSHQRSCALIWSSTG